MPRQRRKLTVEDRVAIDLRRKDGWGVRAIARELGRSPSVISTEIGRGREQDGTYAAGSAQAAAAARLDRSGRRARLAPDSPLFAEVAKLLRLQWSPEQIAGRRKRLILLCHRLLRNAIFPKEINRLTTCAQKY